MVTNFSVRIVSFLIILILITGCKFDVPAPPPKHDSVPAPTVTKSTISMPVTIDMESFKAQLINDIRQKPLASGRSPELSVKMLAEETTIQQIPKTVIDTAAKAESCIERVVVDQWVESITVPVKIAGCVLTFWKKSCWENVVQQVTRSANRIVKDCTPAVEAVTKIAMIPTEIIADKIVGTSAWVNYKVEVDDLNISMNGDEIVANATLNLPVSLDLKEHIFGSSLKVKGAVACNSKITTEAKTKIQLVQNGSGITVNADVHGFDINVGQLCFPGLVQAIEVWSFSSAESAALSYTLKSLIENKLQSYVNEEIAKSAAGLSLNSEIGTSVAKLQGAYAISNDIWLKFEPKQVYISQVIGASTGHQTLTFVVGVDAELTVIYGEKPILVSITNVPVNLGSAGNGFNLIPRGQISISKIQEVATAETAKAAAGKLEENGFILEGVNVYQSGNLIVFSVQIKGNKFARPSGSLYLSGRPTYDYTKRSIVIQDLQFTVESRNWLLKNAASVVRAKIEELIAPKLEFKIDDKLDKIVAENNLFSAPIGNGVIQGTISKVQLGNIWIQGGALNFDLRIEGASQLSLNL